jgi:protein-S-isoprenylcysteine O-methyltransferase Ste14
MALKETFENQGNFLFRYRGHIPIAFILLAIPFAFLNSTVDYFYINLILSLLFVSLGHLVRARTVGRRELHTSGRNRSQQVASRLNTKGWYSMVRHPLYFGNFLIWIGLTFFLGNWYLIVIFCLLFWLYYERIMFAEEQFLERKFGSYFLAWAEQVPAFFPNYKKFQAPENAFSWRIVFKNEYPGVISTMTSFLFLLILKRTAANNVIAFELTDLYFALFILLFGLTFKFLKRKTKVFFEMD